jgi:ABC-2 type transport system permease protein
MDWVRVTTIRATLVILSSLLVLGLAVAALLAVSFRGEELDPELAAVLITNGGALIPIPLAAVFMGVFGTLMVGHDYRHGLVRPVLAAVPSRVAVVGGRMIVLALVAALAGALTVVLNAACGVVVLHRLPIDTGVLQASAGYVTLGVLWSWLAAGATWLLRSTAAVLVLLFVVPLVIEPVIMALATLPSLSAWMAPVVKWLPFAAGRALALTGGGSGQEVSPAQGGLVFCVLVLVVAGAGTLRFATRDA